MGSLKDVLACEIITNVTCPPYKGEKIKISFKSDDEIVQEVVIPEFEGGAGGPALPLAESEVHDATVCGATVLCAARGGFKQIYQISLDVKESTISNNFSPGDTIGIIPRNNANDVDFILECVNLRSQADHHYHLENVQSDTKSQIPKHIPVRSTLRHTFTHCVELRAVVKKLFLLALAKYTTNKLEKQCLQLLCSKEGASLYTDHILNKNVTVVDILVWFESCRPSVTCLLSHLPRLLPRPYSIINSRLRDADTVAICFSVRKSADGGPGLTTAWLQQIVKEKRKKTNENGISATLEEQIASLSLREINDKVKIPIFLRKNMQFSFPKESERVMMIGAGTGIAPYLGFLEERKILKMENSLSFGETWLFYGCRDPDVDYIFKEEIEMYLQENILSRLSTAFSRVDWSIKYVQDAVIANGKEVAEFIEKGAFVFVCGDLSTLAKQTEEALTLCLEQHTERSRHQATQFINCMKKEKKYMLEAWS